MARLDRAVPHARKRLLIIEPQPKFKPALDALAARWDGALVAAAAWVARTNLSLFLHANNSESATLVASLDAPPDGSANSATSGVITPAVPLDGGTMANGSTSGGTRESLRAGFRPERYRTVPAIDVADYLLRMLPPPPASAQVAHATPANAWLDEPVDTHTHPTRRASNASTLAFLKLDIEGAEYTVLPRLLSTRALCRVSFLLIEWHLVYVPPPKRAAGLALKGAFELLLAASCHGHPMPVVVHDDLPANNAVLR